MKEFELKYGCNPNQKPAKLYVHDGSELLAAGQGIEGSYRNGLCYFF